MSDEVKTQPETPVQKAWTDFMRKCAEVGQIEYTLELGEKQREELEIKKHNAKVDLKKLADKYNELMQKQAPAQTETTPETVQ